MNRRRVLGAAVCFLILSAICGLFWIVNVPSDAELTLRRKLAEDRSVSDRLDENIDNAIERADMDQYRSLKGRSQPVFDQIVHEQAQLITLSERRKQQRTFCSLGAAAALAISSFGFALLYFSAKTSTSSKP